MKLRAIALAIVGVATLPANSAHAADDFCSRLIVQAVNQFCQLLPNGLSLCQPVALVGPGQECATPGQPALVPMGAPTLRPLAPWAAPYANIALPKLPAAGLPARAPIQATPASPTTVAAPEAAPAIVTPPAPPADEEAIRLAQQRPVSPSAPLVATPTQPVAPIPPTVPNAPPRPLPSEVIAATPPVVPTRVEVPESGSAAAVATTATADTVTALIRASAATPPPAASAPATPSPVQPVPTPVAVDDGAASVDALAHFDFDSANLTAVGRAELDAWLAEAPKNKPLRVSGHADRLGPEPYNLKLSLRRAQTVKQYLIDRGVNPRRIQLEAKGESEPIKRCKGEATPNTKNCLAPNRRVEILPE